MAPGTYPGAEGLWISILGPLCVTHDGMSVGLGGPRQRAVLARLLLDAGHRVSLDALADAVWSGNPPPGYVTTLRTYVFHLRQALEPARPRRGAATVLVSEPHGYRLAVEDQCVDARLFERAVTGARDMLSRGDASGAYAAVTSALALWRGPPLADISGFPFVAPAIARIEEVRVAALESRFDAALVLRRYDCVLAESTEILAASPLRETVHAQRMLALYRSGRQVEALEAYRHLRTVLVAELGVEPAPPLRELQRRILTQDPSLDPAPEHLRRRASSSRPRRRGRRRSVAVIAVATVFLLAVAAVFVAATTTSRQRIKLVATDSIVAFGADGTVRASFALPYPPTALAVRNSTAWVADSRHSEVFRVDLTTGTVEDTISLEPRGAGPAALAVHGNAAWVADGASGTVTEISMGADAIVDVIKVGRHPSAIAAGAGAVWVSNQSDGTVSRIDPVSGRVSQPIDVGAAPEGIAVGDGAVWVANTADGTVSRVDPHTLHVAAPIPVGAGPRGITVTRTAVWTTDSLDGTVARIDPDDLKVTKFPVGTNPRDIAELSGSLWITDPATPALLCVQPNGGVVRRLPMAGAPRQLAATPTAVWVASARSGRAAH